MENMLDKALKVARSDTVKASGKTLFKDIIGILMYDPNAAWSMLCLLYTSDAPTKLEV